MIQIEIESTIIKVRRNDFDLWNYTRERTRQGSKPARGNLVQHPSSSSSMPALLERPDHSGCRDLPRLSLLLNLRNFLEIKFLK